ncbi:type II secretion system protein [Coraliomargarita algicola]|uniref:Type II secretion system protein n=1 Tax=Coraliomargarita algicola TaxID=3092156 RepID=A0ABZ0RQA4_9BACT|nr:type II secretion system protein [Coraliomargarita sp. J2-16]WPJ95104.1 type II secretion system protein [Coraliomargarita sp. J2-16]
MNLSIISRRATSRHAFTLIELLTVVAVVSILASLALVGISSVRDKAQTAHCGSNIRQIQSLALLWAQDNNGWVPQAMWFLEDINQKRVGATNLRSVGYTDKLGKCPSSEVLAPNYGINSKLVQGSPSGQQWGNNYSQYYEHGRYKYSQIQASDTIVFAETEKVKNWSFGGAAAYMAINVDSNNTLGSRHSGKAWVAYADGHIELQYPADIATDLVWNKGINE